MCKTSTIFLLLDAFRHDYLSKKTTPFLWRCAKEGEHFESVVQSLGFCERTEILTGMRGDESGFFTAIGFSPACSPYCDVEWLSFFNGIEQIALSLLRLVPCAIGSKIHKRVRLYAQRYFRHRGISMPSYHIPYPLLQYFALTEDRLDLRNLDVFQQPSIFTLMADAGQNYYYDSFTALGLATPFHSDQERLDGVVKDMAQDRKNLYLIYISTPDAHGHRYGPNNPKFRAILYDMDRMLEKFVKQSEAMTGNNRYIFVGDHGMLEVQHRFNADKEIDRMLRVQNLRKGKDVLYFLDSTMTRFWALSDRGRDRLPALLMNSSAFLEHGIWMNAEIAERYHAPWPDRRYGDHLWLANPGVLVFPDFFHRIAPCNGMHGYNPLLPESQGTCIYWGKDIVPKKHTGIPLTDVFYLLKRSLEL